MDAKVIEGPFRTPRNMAQDEKGSIHDDSTASKLGFRGGTVAGSIHIDQFAPMLVAQFGDDWFARGNLSLHFMQATVDSERVRAVLEPDGDRARLSMFNEAGDQILTGTAAVGEDPRSELALRLAKQERAAPGALRILRALNEGDQAHGIALRLPSVLAARWLETITEDLPIYHAEPAALAPSLAVHLAHGARGAVVGGAGKSVGLFGALQVQHIAGPLTADTDYLARTQVYALSESPRTENVWYEVTISDKDGAKDIARVMFFLRFMKASSPLWTAA